MIVKCNCPSEGQDRLNGKGMRVANSTDKDSSTRGRKVCRCTVCGELHS